MTVVDSTFSERTPKPVYVQRSSFVRYQPSSFSVDTISIPKPARPT
jgi:hypothetical protein